MAAHMQQWELYSALNRECADVPDLDEQWQELSDRIELSSTDAEPVAHRSVITRFTPFVKWAVGIAAAVVAAVFVIREPATPSAESNFESRLPEYHYKTPSAIPEFSSYEDIVNEIECSGRQLEDAIAQL